MTTISAPQLSERLASGSVRIVDVRTPAEYETARIAGSLNVPLDVVRERTRDVAERIGGDAVLVCRTGQRAERARRLLADAGNGGGVVLDGGLSGWETGGFDVERGHRRWELERQVRLVAGSVVLGSVLGSVAVPRLKWVAAAIGGGLTFAALSDTCAMASALSRLPYNRGADYDPHALVAALSAS